MDFVPDTLVCELRGHVGAVFRVRFNNDGRYCMTAGNDRTIRLWNPHRVGSSEDEALLIRSFEGQHNYAVHDVAISHDNGSFASCGGDRAVMLWDVRRGDVVRKFPGHQQRVQSVAFNKDSSVLCSASHDSTVRAYDMRARGRSPIQVLDAFSDTVSCVRCTDRHIIASSIDGTVRSFDLRAGKLITDHLGAPVTSVALSRDQVCLFALCVRPPSAEHPAGADGIGRLWELGSGSELSTYKGHKNREYPLDAAFSATDALLLACGEDGCVTAWDMVHGSVHGRLQAHADVCGSIAVHPDTRTADSSPFWITAGFDGRVRMWSSEQGRQKWRDDAAVIMEREGWEGHAWQYDTSAG